MGVISDCRVPGRKGGLIFHWCEAVLVVIHHWYKVSVAIYAVLNTENKRSEKWKLQTKLYKHIV